jgi:hypothetical protein
MARRLGLFYGCVHITKVEEFLEGKWMTSAYFRHDELIDYVVSRIGHKFQCHLDTTKLGGIKFYRCCIKRH